MASEFNIRAFDAVLVLGNFISLIHDYKDRNRCLEQFYKILRQGGILIIDLRNYEKISENRSVVGNVELFYKMYSGNSVYCGDVVKGWPHKIDDEKKIVTFHYAENTSSRPAEIPLYMIKRDELKMMLDENFTNIEEYSDFKSGYSKDADFFMYVAEKPNE